MRANIYCTSCTKLLLNMSNKSRPRLKKKNPWVQYTYYIITTWSNKLIIIFSTIQVRSRCFLYRSTFIQINTTSTKFNCANLSTSVFTCVHVFFFVYLFCFLLLYWRNCSISQHLWVNFGWFSTLPKKKSSPSR